MGEIKNQKIKPKNPEQDSVSCPEKAFGRKNQPQERGPRLFGGGLKKNSFPQQC